MIDGCVTAFNWFFAPVYCRKAVETYVNDPRSVIIVFITLQTQSVPFQMTTDPQSVIIVFITLQTQSAPSQMTIDPQSLWKQQG
jgi:hypothetical protein